MACDFRTFSVDPTYASSPGSLTSGQVLSSSCPAKSDRFADGCAQESVKCTTASGRMGVVQRQPPSGCKGKDPTSHWNSPVQSNGHLSYTKVRYLRVSILVCFRRKMLSTSTDYEHHSDIQRICKIPVTHLYTRSSISRRKITQKLHL